MKPLVFISSVSLGYEKMRRIARKAIIESGGRPVGFEDLPALNKSSRNACLDSVRDCDIYVGILGARYGSLAPSGKSITEEEYDEAVRLGKSRLLFVEEGPDPEFDQREFIKRAGNYRSGRIWKKFRDHSELNSQIASALGEIISMKRAQLSPEVIQKRLNDELGGWKKTHHSRAWLATAGIPTDSCEFLGEAKFSDVAIPRNIFLVGQEIDPSVFEIEQAKEKKLNEDHWQLTQTEPSNRREGEQLSFVRIYQDGLFFVAMNVTGREPNNDLDMYIDPKTVALIASAQLHFLAKVYDFFDPHSRWDRIALQSAVFETEYRTFGSPTPGQTSHSMRMSGSEKPIIAFNSPKYLERIQFLQKEYVDDLVAVLRRRLK